MSSKLNAMTVCMAGSVAGMLLINRPHHWAEHASHGECCRCARGLSSLKLVSFNLTKVNLGTHQINAEALSAEHVLAEKP